MNSLVESHPELLEEWDYEKNVVSPSEVSFGSIKKVWWKCKEGHAWQSTPNSRTYMKSGCPKCSVQRISSGNSLTAKHPELLSEWDYEKNAIKPEEVSFGSRKKVWWKCKKGHSWESRVHSRTWKKTGCPTCFKSKPFVKESIIITHPELLEEWDYKKNAIKPEEVSFGSHKKIWWKCKEGHSWKVKVNSRSFHKSGCPICAKSKLSGKASIMATHPELMKEWDHEKNIIKPEEISYGSGKKVWWKCKHGHSWKTTPNLRTNMKSGCPFCIGKRVSNKNNLAVKYPELAKEWDYEKNAIKPEEISYGSGKKFWWKCKKGHSWQASPNARTNMKSACAYCPRKKD